MLTLPRKTRHLQLSNVEVTFAFVLHDGLHEFNDRLHHTRWDNHADVVIEQDILFGIALAFRPQTFATECKALLTSEACQAQLTRFPAADCSTVST